MKNSKLEVLIHFNNNERCIFCKTDLVDPVFYGTIYKYEDIITHYFCLLLSSKLMPEGNERDGILGFLPKDIKSEVNRGRRLHCKYCKKSGATIGCAVETCRVGFHLPCGIAKDAQNLFYDNFPSFCIKHRSLQCIPQSKLSTTEDMTCSICLDNLSLSFTQTIWASCCKTALYHKRCIQEVALNSGYYFRCPNCNDDKSFRPQMLKSGIYIPDQDASWESEPGAFSTLTERYSHCDAAICCCSNGRDFCQDKGNWQIILCYRCLLKGIHRRCGKGVVYKEQWTCSSPSCLSESESYFQTTSQCSPEKIISTLESSSNKLTENKENLDPNFSSDRINMSTNRPSNVQRVCIFCNSNSRCSYLGSMDVLKKNFFHRNCLLFSSGIFQNENKSKGLYGFEETTIKKEWHRGHQQMCRFCKKLGATVNCSAKNCQVAFHLPCAILENCTLHLSFGKFKSYCNQHAPKCIVDGRPIVGILMEAKLSKCCKLPECHEYCNENALDVSRWSNCPNCISHSKFKEDFIEISNAFILRRKAHVDREGSYHVKCSSPECLWKRRKLRHFKESISSEAVNGKCGNITKHEWCNTFCVSESYKQNLWTNDEEFEVEKSDKMFPQSFAVYNKNALNAARFSSNFSISLDPSSLKNLNI